MKLLASAYIFNAPGQCLKHQKFPVPEPASGEILVKNNVCTICGSDLHSYLGKRKEQTPCILGHEIVGTITALPDDEMITDYYGNKLKAGDKITWTVCASCGECHHCRNGNTQKCEKLIKYGHLPISDEYIWNGGFAEYTLLKKGTDVFILPDYIPDHLLAPLNCSYATVAAAIRLAASVKGKNVFIFGAGMLGILTVAMCKVQGAAHITIIDPKAERLETTKLFGADKGILWDDCKKAPEKFAGKYGAEIIFEMSGSNKAIDTALKMLGIGGTLILAGSVFPVGPVQINPENIVRKLWTIKGIHNYIAEDLATAVNFLVDNVKNFPFQKLYEEQEFGLKDINVALEKAQNTKQNRVIVRT